VKKLNQRELNRVIDVMYGTLCDDGDCTAAQERKIRAALKADFKLVGRLPSPEGYEENAYCEAAELAFGEDEKSTGIFKKTAAVLASFHEE